jgi:hypothetical protein
LTDLVRISFDFVPHHPLVDYPTRHKTTTKFDPNSVLLTYTSNGAACNRRFGCQGSIGEQTRLGETYNFLDIWEVVATVSTCIQ